MQLLNVAGLVLCALPSLGSANTFAARQAPEDVNVTAPVPRSFIIEYAAVSKISLLHPVSSNEAHLFRSGLGQVSP